MKNLATAGESAAGMNDAIKDWNMPVISKFYGIVIRILRAQGLEPRFHAIYGNSELVVSIWPLAVVQGDAPRRVREMVLEWAIQHQQELLGAWNRCRFGQMPQPISPLL